MKENKLIEMSNKIESLTRVTQQIINKISQLEMLLVHVTEVVKRLDEFEKISNQLKQESDDRKRDSKEASQ
jgi:hypothetical protein